jgi:hypothetical protein
MRWAGHVACRGEKTHAYICYNVDDGRKEYWDKEYKNVVII